MTTVNDIPGDTPTEQRDWLFRQWRDVSDMLRRVELQRDALKSEIELLRVALGNRPAEDAKPVDVWPDRW